MVLIKHRAAATKRYIAILLPVKVTVTVTVSGIRALRSIQAILLWEKIHSVL